MIFFFGTAEHIVEIDSKINEYAKNWDMDRIGSVELSILRMSVYSFIYRRDIPPNVVIDEAIDLTRRFCDEESYKFINGVLDGIAGFFNEAENQDRSSLSKI